MKQNIRIETFETSSSSYHTLSIVNVKDTLEEHKEIIKNEDLVITSKVKRETFSYTSSYQYIAKSNYEKAQCILRFIAYRVEDQLMDMVDKSEYVNLDEPEYINGKWNSNRDDYEKYYKLQDELFYQVPLIKAFINAIKRYIGEEYDVIIPERRNLEGVSDEDKDLYELFGLNNYEELDNIELMTDKFYNIIFNPEYVIKEECESNE